MGYFVSCFNHFFGMFDRFFCEVLEKETILSFSLVLLSIDLFIQLNKEDYLLLEVEYSFGLLNVFEVLIWFVSLLNMLFTFTKTKRYQLFFADKKILETSQTGSLKVEPIDMNPQIGSFFDFFRWKKETKFKDIIVLYSWCPGKNNLYLFCFLSPVSLFLFHNVTKDFLLFSLVSVFLISTIFLLFINFYEKQLLNQRILHGEVINEYDSKFVIPRLNLLEELNDSLLKEK